jgi:hypothetical protein
MCRCFRGLVIFTAMTLLVASPSRAASGLAGSTSLGLVEAPASLLGLDLKALEWEVCGNPNGDPTIRGTVIVIANDGGGNSGDRSRLAVEILDEEPGPLEGMVLASVRPVLFELIGGAPITLSCGSFTYKVLLDDEVVQPVSILTLVGGDRTGAYGTCAGNLSIEARLYLTRIERPSETLSFPRSLTLQVSGHWALLTRQVDEGVSPLVLMADQVGGKIVPWPSCLGAVDDLGTILCFAGEVPGERP